MNERDNILLNKVNPPCVEATLERGIQVQEIVL